MPTYLWRYIKKYIKAINKQITHVQSTCKTFKMTTSSPKYSFVLPAYKGQFIKESIDSILAQNYKDFELIIVDDASPDNIKGVVSSYDDARIRYYQNEENIGGTNLVAQWNHSVEYANGDWIILATDDDIYEKTFLETADRLLTKYPNVDIFRGRIASFDSTSKSILFADSCLPEYTCLEEFCLSSLLYLLGGIPQYVFRKTALESIGGFVDFPKAWGSDDATALLLASNGIVCSNDFLVKFRQSEQNISFVCNWNEEKAIATIMYLAFCYEKILPLFSNDTSYKRYWDTTIRTLIYPFQAKKNILNLIHKIPFTKRKKFLDLIDKYTPYLDSRNKMTMKIRVFFKIK